MTGSLDLPLRDDSARPFGLALAVEIARRKQPYPRGERDPMALWDRVRTELDRAGRVAADAFDEGRLRLEMLRARRHADIAAQRLGYAVYKARKTGQELTAEEYAGFARAVEAAENEAERYRRLIDDAVARRRHQNTLQTRPPSAGME
jgi:hypothetical protein